MRMMLTSREAYSHLLAEFQNAALAAALVPREDTRQRYTKAAIRLAEWIMSHKALIDVQDVDLKPDGSV